MTDLFQPSAPVVLWHVTLPPLGQGATGLPVISDADSFNVVFAGPWVQVGKIDNLMAYANFGPLDTASGLMEIQSSDDGETVLNNSSAVAIPAGGTGSSVLTWAADIEAGQYVRVAVALEGGQSVFALSATLLTVPGLASAGGDSGGSIESVASDSLAVSDGTGPNVDIELAITSESLTVTMPEVGTFNIEISETGASLNTESDSAADIPLSADPTVVLTTADLAVGTWLVVATGYAAITNTSQITLQAIEGTATAALTGGTECLVGASGDTFAPAFQPFALSFLAVVSEEGTLEFSASVNNLDMDFDLLGYVAVQIDPIPIGASLSLGDQADFAGGAFNPVPLDGDTHVITAEGASEPPSWLDATNGTIVTPGLYAILIEAGPETAPTTPGLFVFAVAATGASAFPSVQWGPLDGMNAADVALCAQMVVALGEGDVPFSTECTVGASAADLTGTLLAQVTVTQLAF